MQPKGGPAFISPIHPLREIGSRTVIYHLPSVAQSFDCRSREQTWFTTLFKSVHLQNNLMQQSNACKNKACSDLIFIVIIIININNKCIFYSICVTLKENIHFQTSILKQYLARTAGGRSFIALHPMSKHIDV